MTEARCVRCGRPMPHQAYVCHHEAQELSEALTAAAGHAEDAEAVIARQTRYGDGGRGGSDDPLPGDLTAAAKLAPIANTIGTWVRVVTEEAGRRPRWRPVAGPPCPPPASTDLPDGAVYRCEHDSCEAIRRRTAPPQLALEAAWLATQTSWLAKHPAAAEAFDQLERACDALARLVDRPPADELVGMCDCGKVLYAPRGKTVVTCPNPKCKLHWNVAESRDILRNALDGKLVTAAEAARLSAFLDSDRTQAQIRKLINKWAERGELVAHPLADTDEPAFRFGDIFARLARTPRRTPQTGVAA